MIRLLTLSEDVVPWSKLDERGAFHPQMQIMRIEILEKRVRYDDMAHRVRGIGVRSIHDVIH